MAICTCNVWFHKTWREAHRTKQESGSKIWVKKKVYKKIDIPRQCCLRYTYSMRNGAEEIKEKL